MNKKLKKALKAERNRDRVKRHRQWKAIYLKHIQNDIHINTKATSKNECEQANHHNNNQNNNSNNKTSFKDRLRRWAIKFNISKNAVTDLLKLLIAAGFTELPGDSRTLFETPRTVEMKPLTNGKLWYDLFVFIVHYELVHKQLMFS